MMLGHKLFSSGLPPLATAAIGNDVSSGLTATGTNQSTAYSLTAADNEFTTVVSGTGAILYAGTPGDSQTVYNGGANALTVYPPSGSQINGMGTNSGVLIPTATGCLFKCMSSTRWIGILSR